MNQIDPIALFRLSVLGPLVSREKLDRGELQQTLRALAERDYAIPGTRRRHLGEKTIQAWYYAWRKQGIDGLTPKPRIDRGQSKLAPATQAAILAAKRDNPRRSIRQIQQLLEAAGSVAHGSLARSTIHRLLQQHGLSRINGSASLPEEKRSFVAATAGAIWYGDVMHGPRVPMGGRLAKVYLVTLFDDASRLVAHSAFCTGETALDIEGVLKQALLKRGVPIRLIVEYVPWNIFDVMCPVDICGGLVRKARLLRPPFDIATHNLSEDDLPLSLLFGRLSCSRSTLSSQKPSTEFGAIG